MTMPQVSQARPLLPLPPLYPITDARLERTLSEQIRRLGEAGFPLVQFRGKPLNARAQMEELDKALRESAARGGWPAICVNDRADLALLAAQAGVRPWGLHLGQGDLPPGEARQLPGLEALHLGTSTHNPEEWASPDPVCDHAGLGPFRATETKGDHAQPIGLEGLRLGCSLLRSRGLAPVAIGGLTLADAPACYDAGAEALAMVGALARSGDPEALLWEAQVARWRCRSPLVPGQGVVLIGGSGSGKSTLAPELAARMGLPALDSDGWVERRTGQRIHEIFAERGEAAFRSLEVESIQACLERPAVVALGAGAWEAETTRAGVRRAGFQVLWLAEVPERAWARVQGDRARPLAAHRDEFMERWSARSVRWAEAPMVLPLGRRAEALAEALMGG